MVRGVTLSGRRAGVFPGYGEWAIADAKKERALWIIFAMHTFPEATYSVSNALPTVRICPLAGIPWSYPEILNDANSARASS